MSSPFAITTTNNTLQLDNNQRGQAVFTVSNTTTRMLHCRAHIVAQPEIASPWLTIQGEAEQDIAASGSQQYTVLIAVPTGTQASDYLFRLNVVDQANPDDDFSEGPSVKFTVTPSIPTPKPFPWWIVAIIIGTIILISGSIYGINKLTHPTPISCLHASTQTLTLASIETATDPSTQTITLNNCGSPGNWTSKTNTSNGGAWLTAITPSGGALATDAKQDIVITAIDNPIGSNPLKTGTYTGTVIFTLGGSSVSVPVTFNVKPGPSLNPTTLTISELSGQVRISTTVLTNNSTTGTVSVEVTTNDGHNWLSTDIANGSPISEGGNLTINITAKGIFNAGGYTGHVKLIIKTSTGTASVVVTVNLHIIHF